MAAIFLLFGIKEKTEFSKDAESAPGFFKSIKMTLSNKSFRPYVPANFVVWYIFGLVITISALYCSFVLGIKDSFMISLLLGLIFISAAGFMFLWRFIILKIGIKKGLMLAFVVTIILMAPFMFISDLIGAVIVFTLLGIGFAGLTFCRDIVMATIIDDDELKTGMRREASFYGVNAIFIRLATIAVVISISLVFTSVGWAVFDPRGDTTQIIWGLRILMFVFPAVALGFAILCMSRFPITKERAEEIKREIKKIHAEKKQQMV
jgi:GPH family glycoside/pentoside/hexuronide:cation symporter